MKHTIKRYNKNKTDSFIVDDNIMKAAKHLIHNGVDEIFIDGQRITIHSDYRTDGERVTIINVEEAV